MSILSLIGWYTLPKYATNTVLYVYYGITIRAGDPKPQPGSPRYARDRRRIFIAIVTTYLLYNLFEVYQKIRGEGSFYEVLGVSPLADERTIKARFRRLAAQHHPDKLGAGSSSDLFVYLKQAQDTLTNPVKRYAYDMWGPKIQDWGNIDSAHGYFLAGLMKTVPAYLISFIGLLLLNYTWWSDWGRYWRFFAFAALFTLNLALISHQGPVFISSTFFLLPWQIMKMAETISLSLHIFISQIAPPEAKNADSPDRLYPQTVQRLGQLLHLSRATDTEATRLLQLGFAPFQGDRESVATLRKGMKEGLVLSSVRGSSGVQQAVKEVVERRKLEKKDG
ncbi:J domain-containing protein [Aspergillus undulatus]|uniref:J domain-containing protein n=1 Tax=Aspergillus undulatus TaxID=1810928 RepID=UPI003CCDCCF6